MVVIDVVDASIIFSSRAFFYLFCVKKKRKKKVTHTLTHQTVKKSLRVLFFASLPSQNTKRREREREREKKRTTTGARE
jgi:hypothetical protein